MKGRSVLYLNKIILELNISLLMGDQKIKVLKLLGNIPNSLAYWVSEPDSGQANAINKGWKRSTGSILAWLNSDDWFAPGAVSAGIDYLQTHPKTGIVYGDCYWVNEKGEFIRSQAPPEFNYCQFVLGMNDYIPSGSTFLRRSVFEMVGDLDESMHFTLDHDYWLRAGLMTQINLLDEVLSYFRVYSEAKTWSNSPGKASDIIYMYEKLFKCNDLPFLVKAKRKYVLSRAYLKGADYFWLSGKKFEYYKFLLKSILVNPFEWNNKRIKSLIRAFLGRNAELTIASKIHKNS